MTARRGRRPEPTARAAPILTVAVTLTSLAARVWGAGVEPPPNVVGVSAGLEATPVASLHASRRGSGILAPQAETALSFTSALLTRLGGGRVRLERDEALLRSARGALRLLLGTGVSYASDAGGTSFGWHAVLGVRATSQLGRWELGARLAYLPVLVGHLRLSAFQRDTFADRYPDARDTPGPSGATVWLPGQRVDASLTARAALGSWILLGDAGVLMSPAAGRNWNSLELGQLPLLVRVGAARTF